MIVTRQSLVERQVDHILKFLLAELSDIFPHPVIHNHRIIQGITNNGQQGSNN